MKSLILGYCPIGNGTSIAPFDEVFDTGQDISRSISGVDAVVFWGGTDIHPSFYNEKAHQYSQASHVPSARDEFERKAMLYCITNNIPIIGVCRGAQLMCAVAGGSLIQHVTGHVGKGDHKMVTSDGEYITTTSCHHQMMYPYDVEHELLAWASHNLSTVYENGENKTTSLMAGRKEPEVVFFPRIRGLAIQGHPEWAVGSRFAQYCNELIVNKLLTNEVLET